MKLAVKNNEILGFLENKLLILWLVFLLFLSSSGMLSYKIVSFSKDNQQIIQFSHDLDNMIETSRSSTQKQENNLEKDDKIKAVKKVSISQDFSTKDPFQALLKKVEKVELNQQVKSNRDQKVINNKIVNNQRMKEDETEDILRNIELLGMLNNESSRVAIIKFSESLIKIMKNGEEFAGLRIKEIKDDEIVVESKGKYYIYTLGGEDN